MSSNAPDANSCEIPPRAPVLRLIFPPDLPMTARIVPIIPRAPPRPTSPRPTVPQSISPNICIASAIFCSDSTTIKIETALTMDEILPARLASKITNTNSDRAPPRPTSPRPTVPQSIIANSPRAAAMSESV